MTSHDRRVDVVLVDVFGTLLSLADLPAACDAVAPGRGAQLAARWRARQIELTWLRTMMGAWLGFERVTLDALGMALEEVVGADAAVRVTVAERAGLATAFERLPLAEGAREALATLRAAGIGTGLLSNGTAAQLARIVEDAGLTDDLAPVLSTDAVRAYKPDPRVYALAPEACGLPPERIGFVTANAWDAAGAGAFGFRVAWLRGEGAPPLPPVGAPRPIETTWAGVPGLYVPRS